MLKQPDCDQNAARFAARGSRRRTSQMWRAHAILLFAALVVQLPASAAKALDLIRRPYLQQGTPTSIIVRWRTDQPADTILRYGPAFNDLSTTIATAGLVTEHEVEVQNLQPFTRYYYSVGTSSEILEGEDATHYFVTSPSNGTSGPTRLWVIGDSGQNSSKSLEVQNEYLNFAGNNLADVWLMLGDNAYLTGSDPEYTNNLFNNFPSILRNTVLWPAPGNHDFQGDPPISSNPNTETGPYYEAFTLPTQAEAGGIPSGMETYYSFDYANIHLIAFNYYKFNNSEETAAYAWLVADLAATQQDWVIVYLHFNPYSRGERDSDTDFHMTKTRTVLNPIFEQGGVDLVLSGHSHSYERSMLIDGHYGIANTLTPGNIIHGGDGDPAGDGAYLKLASGPTPHSGTVYVVNGVGENAHQGAWSFDHPVMVRGYDIEGSMVIDVDGDTLDAYFISRFGDILDRFRIKKVANLPGLGPVAMIVLTLAMAGGAWRLRVRR